MDWSAVVSRWAHVSSAIILLGSCVFLRYVLMPAADVMAEAEHQALRDRIMKRWRVFVHVLVAVLLVTGLYNFWLRMSVSPERPWHMLAGIKLLLGLFVLFVASALVGRSKGLEPLRRNSRFWLQVNIMVAFAAVLISGYLKFLPATKS